MQFVHKVKMDMSTMSDEALVQARARLKNSYTFYWNITQEANIDLTKTRGKSAQDNCNEINEVGLLLKAEIDKRTNNKS